MCSSIGTDSLIVRERGRRDREERWERFVEALNRRMEFGPQLRNEIFEDIDPHASNPTA